MAHFPSASATVNLQSFLPSPPDTLGEQLDPFPAFGWELSFCIIVYLISWIFQSDAVLGSFPQATFSVDSDTDMK